MRFREALFMEGKSNFVQIMFMCDKIEKQIVHNKIFYLFYRRLLS